MLKNFFLIGLRNLLKQKGYSVIKVALVSFMLASGIAYYAMTKWLSDFQYSIKIGAGIFIAAGAASLLIALFTVSFQALKSAVGNPVDSLRSE